MNMLNELQRKRAGRAIGIVCGEGGHLPFLPGLFDAIVFARVLYLIADCIQCCEKPPPCCGPVVTSFMNGATVMLQSRGFRRAKNSGRSFKRPESTRRSTLALARRPMSIHISSTWG